jgi:pentatricopeptide repeat protein
MIRTVFSVFPFVLLVVALAGPECARSADAEGAVKLFNGKDLTGFYTWLKGHGKNNDTEKVFTVHDGMIHVTGKVFGGFITVKEYENYHLVTEFKWGEKTYAPR